MFLAIKLKKIWIFSILAVIILIVTSFLHSHAGTMPLGSDILSSMGINVEEPPIERKTVTLPKRDDPVFITYNALQQEAGFDLTPYAGTDVMRITYETKYQGKPFRLNLLFCGDTLIGGDLCSVSLDGEMYPLRRPL